MLGLNARDVFNSNLMRLNEISKRTQNEREISGAIVKDNGIFNNDVNLKIPNLADSNKLPTSKVDHLLAKI